MRRTLVVALLALLVLGLASPAFAQKIPAGTRDPFEPLVTEDTTGATGVAGVAGTTDTDPTNGVDNDVSSGGLSNTGADPSPWLAVAYLLIAFGVSAVVWARVRAPVTH
jgi:hypothetical protein